MADSKKKSKAAELAAKNLAQIQKIDPCANKLLDKVPHTALYKFQKDKRSWMKTDIEGTMFVYQRCDRPFFSFLIANRQSPEDFIVPIGPNLQFKSDKKYLFICTQDCSINVLWFYEEDDCARIANLLEKLLEKTKKTETSAESNNTTDSRSQQLLDLIKGGQHNQIKHVSDVETKDFDAGTGYGKSTVTKTSAEGSSNSMPVLLQKLMIQEQPRTVLKEPGTAMLSDELEKDLLKSAKPKNILFQDFANSPSAASLAAFSTRSVHGSEGENEQEIAETESVAPESSFVMGSGTNTPPLNKEQFASALLHLMQTDDQFLCQIHQAYIDAINRRLRLDGN
ncbi:unnamed protein product [Caenorhabditis auriculariae]|uniref:mRNA-decapping enzyme C-terminal domain-containing protein n=1 Tax=Caenorhabditis auriculariae TaxID=2777116 RepID=A0A8S1HKU1_9PELO|nr:unnamed protein product [Caenorhabditis auriculariae]